MQSLSVPAGVHVGQDGWLFLTGGTNNVLDLYSDFGVDKAFYVDQWITLLAERQRRASLLGAQYIHTVAPDKLTIYHERFGDGAISVTHAPAHQIAAGASVAGLEEL